jgi:PiT family inorganic phosphate transporter
MTVSQFWQLLVQYPWAFFPLIMDLAVVFVNGWTDGPNSIATLVMTRSMRPRMAVAMSAVLNLLGVLSIGLIAAYSSVFSNVAETIASLVSFKVTSEASLNDAFIALGMGLVAVVIFSNISTKLNLPSSESNELVGGLTGGALALVCLPSSVMFGDISAVNGMAWIKVLAGFFGSLVLGFFLGFVLTKLIEVICRKMTRGKTTRFFTKGQIVSAGLMSYAHGLQDGSKFIGVLVIVALMLGNFAGLTPSVSSLVAEFYIYVPVALLMFAGSCMGGFNIIKTLGKDMAKLQKYQAFATDIASFIGLLLVTFLGIPVSTGTVKTTAIMGCGASQGLRKVKWNVAGKMVGLWILVFPVTALLGFLLTLALAAIIQ